MGQCVMYCVGYPVRKIEGYDETRGNYYSAAALVIIERKEEERSTSWVTVPRVLQVRNDYAELFWIYEFHRRCLT